MPTNPTWEETTDIAPAAPTWDDTSETPPIDRALERENLAREMRQARAEGVGAKALSGLANVGERAAYTISLMDPLTAVGRLINPHQQSALPQEAVRAAIDYLDPFSQANVVPGSAIEGAKQFGSELVSGLAQPEAVGALMTGRVNPQLPGRLFQPSLIKGSQQAAANLAQAETPTEAVKSALELGLTAGGTAGIEAHAARAGRPIPTDLSERPAPVTGRTLRQPEGAKPPTESRQAQLAAEEALPPTEELAAPPTTKLSPEAERAVEEAETAPSTAPPEAIPEAKPQITSQKNQPRISVEDLSKEKAMGAYSPFTGKVALDKASVSEMSPEERAAVVRHELAHKIETELELWQKSDDFLWRLWEQDRINPIWDLMGEATGRWQFGNDLSPEIIATLYAEHYPKGTFTVKERPITYDWEGENWVGPKEYPIPKELMEVLDKIESELGIWSKKKQRGTAEYPDLAKPAAPAPETPPLEPGPGAQTVGEPKYAAIAQLTDQLNAAPPLGAKEKLAWRERAADAWAQGKSALEKAFAKTESIKTTLREMQRGVREITDLDRRVASLDYLLQRSAGQSRANGKAIQRAVRNKPMREAIAIWIDSGGDTAAIQSVLDNLPKGIKGSVRRALQRAVDLPPEAKQIAEQFKQFFGIREQDALQAEIFEKGLEDYYSHIWEKPENMPDKLRTAITNGKVSDYFQFARQRKIPTFLEGIAQGKNPILDPAKVLPYYNYALDRAIASREFIKSLSDLQAPDGLPAVLPTGTASVVEAGEAGRTNGAMLINPRGKRLGIVKKGIETQEEANAIAQANKLRVVPDPSDPTKFAVRYPVGEDLKYRLIDHPAMRKWKWIGTNENGDPIMYKSDLAVHPLLYKRLARMMDRGLLTPTEWGRRALRFSSEIKAIKLAAFPSMFHQVHVGSHALWHWTNPFKTAEINWDSPATKFAIEKGHLKLAADPQELANFSEGVLGPGLIHKVPMLGPISRGYSEWLFGDYIPRLKLKTFENAYERNLKWYAKDIQKGKVTPEEIASRVGDSINNAYGELNHLFLGKYGRDPRFQRLLRGIFLAPDFGEARLRFTEKALTKFGHEEHVAFATMVITMYMAARIANVISHGDPEWDWDKAFSVKAGKHWYSMRSVAGDIVHAMKNAGQFMYVRLNPVYSRTISDFLFRRDPQGRKLSWDQMLLSRPAEQLIPINFANLTREDQTLWESLITSMGAQSRHDVPAYELGKKVREYMASSRDVKMQARAERAEQEIFAPSDYKSIRLALKNGDLDKARSEYRSLMVEKGKNPRDIDQALSPYTASHQSKPYGGLSLTEWTRFKRTLRPYDLQILKDADAERALIYDNFRRMKAGMR